MHSSLRVCWRVCVHVCLAVWDWMAPFREGVRPCGLRWLLWREAGGPSWFREKSSLTSQSCLTACQPTWHTRTCTHTQSHSTWLRRLYTEKKNAENHTLLSMQLKRFILPPMWFGYGLCKVQIVSVSQLSLCMDINITCKEVWRTHLGLLFTWGQCCVHPLSLQRFNHFSWPAARIWWK